MKVKLTKMEGLGNDFLLADDRNGEIEGTRDYGTLARTVCDRHFGIGADGLILALTSKSHDIGFRIFNSDGSEAEMCGNGMRCFARFVKAEGILDQDTFTVETQAGTIIPEIVETGAAVSQVKVDMGEPILETGKIPFAWDTENAVDVPLEADGTTWSVTPVSMGNPHAVIFVDSHEGLELEDVGPGIETHPRFPEKTNVEFVTVKDRKHATIKVWERGAGMTLACGTGACAVLTAGVLTDRLDRRATLTLPGGDLGMEWDETTNHLFKTGPARTVFVTEIGI